MRGCNVARRRRTLSAFPPGRSIRWHSSATEPVSDGEFLRAFERVYPRVQWTSQSRLGLAISGGVDSMALATLYANLRRVNPNMPTPHGIIVDHKVRPESTDEAEWVAEQLRSKLNISSTIAPLTWATPSDRESFETKARELRYQAIGLACRDHQIQSLLVAHHADDLVEGAIMRLMRCRFRSGLQGMQRISPIPECDGIHGVHQSSSLRAYEPSPQLPFYIERGGVQMLRPLLDFEKSRLIATCEKYNTSWAEDKTNRDATLTVRNAIRHMVRQYKFPEALSPKSLISLTQRISDRVRSHEEHAEKIFNGTNIALDIQTASLVVRFPPASEFLAQPIVTESDRHLARNTAHLYLRRLLGLVSYTRDSQTTAAAIDWIWPSLRLKQDSHASPQRAFDIGRIHFEPWDKQTHSPPSKGVSEKPNQPAYLLRHAQVPGPQENSSRMLAIPPSPSATSSPSESEWFLFDARFWLRITNHTADPLVLRFITPPDMDATSKVWQRASSDSPSPPHGFDLVAALDLLNPSSLRFTIPAIFRKDKDTGEETLVALPSLGVGGVQPGTGDVVCTWGIRYRKVGFGARRAEDVVVPGISMENVGTRARRLWGKRRVLVGNKKSG